MISPVEAWVAKCTGLNDRLSVDTLLKWQLDKTRKIIEYTRTHSRFYAEKLQGIDTKKIKTLSDMQEIDFTWPEDILRDSKAFVCVPQSQIARIVTLYTSGSQGAPKRIYFTEQDMEKTVDFFTHGMSTMVHKGQTVVVFMSGETQNSIGDLLKKALKRIGVSTQIYGRIDDVYKAIKAAKTADCLIGVPAEIIYMCRTDESLRPQSVLLSTDYVPDSVIRSIEDTWKCQVFTHYGMTETGFGLGVQCEAGLGYHLRDADLLVEIVDPKTGLQVPPGKCGEIVITTFSREAMPLIRYRTGDIAHLIVNPCPCGGILPQLGKVMGRVSNIISLENSQQLSIYYLDEIMFAFPEVRNFEASLIKTARTNILNITVDAKESLQHEDLLRYLKNALSHDIEIQIKFDKIGPYVGQQKRSISLEKRK